MENQSQIPIIALVGRPNVGQSSLFNRYTGHRRALVADTPGLTRDRIVESIEILDRPILLVDTAGLDPDAHSGLPAAVQAQAEAAVREADAILFVVDGKSGALPEDEAIARTLRRTHKPLSLLVNKVDVPHLHSDRLLDFHRLGFERTWGVSAEHGGGAFDALEDLVRSLPAPKTSEPAESGTPRIALIGRPNVGKSSLVNRLLGEERVVVSDQPGTTRDAIDVRLEQDGQEFILVDTAGLRRPGRRSGAGEQVGALMSVRALQRAQVALLLIDAEEGFTDQDAHIGRLARDMGVGTVTVPNKWDRVESGQRKDVLESVTHGLRFMPDSPLIPISALTGAGLGKLWPAVAQVARASAREIPTADLNRWLEETVARHDPGMARRGSRSRPLKFQYAAQTGTHPPSFVLFCTEPDSVLASYERYLENRLREAFDLAGTPIRITLRSRRREGP
ncbi:MAG: ribosome biogenesis GTPase Der [Myxococcota bacterium]|nr:ribosome biogenesis GTPase Der [Myxococcota bacterium]